MEVGIARAKSYSSHISMLIKALLISKGPVCELGSGFFSTPLLHWICKSMGRRLITYEENDEYYEFAKRFRSKMHSVKKVENWDDVDFSGHWGVALVDHSTRRRGQDIIRLKDVADYIVIHDTEGRTNRAYGYDKAFPQFKYRFDWIAGYPNTSVVSNFYPLDEFGKKL